VLQRVVAARRQEWESERHMRIMAKQEKQRLSRDICRLDSELDGVRDRATMYEVRLRHTPQLCYTENVVI